MDKKTVDLANDVLDIARNRLLVNLRYLDTALTFQNRAVYDGTQSTDGRSFFFDPVFILKSYRDSKEFITRSYLHTVLHCIFHHPFMGRAVNRDLWDMACDMAVESVINELGLSSTTSEKSAKQEYISKKIRLKTGFLTAEKIYAYLKADNDISEQELREWSDLFFIDDHSLWYHQDALSENAENNSAAKPDVMLRADDPELITAWKDIAEHAQMELEMFAKVRGKKASALVQNLRAVNRERYDYTTFLRQFAAANETIKVSEDEFDYIYYNYGLTHYGRMPLIEPLEYREDKKITDFVIAVDTSGSVAGEEVQAFLQKTYDILKQREAFNSKVNIHILQCDAKIQSDHVITDAQDIEHYFETTEIKGLGGTDFRPVFEYVDDLIARGDITDLKGLIYFTDGLGIYPDQMPQYKTAFVFVESGYNIPEVPVWAMKVILSAEELGEL